MKVQTWTMLEKTLMLIKNEQFCTIKENKKQKKHDQIYKYFLMKNNRENQNNDNSFPYLPTSLL